MLRAQVLAKVAAGIVILLLVSMWHDALQLQAAELHQHLRTSRLSDELTTSSLNGHFLRESVARRLLHPVEPLVVGVVGGSISASKNWGEVHYHTQLVDWLNRFKKPDSARRVDDHELEKHIVTNRALPATESDITALCIDSLFQGGPKPDLLLIEFGYNDAFMAPDEAVDTPEAIATHPAANIERIIRAALSWGTAVILVEFSSLNKTSWRPSDHLSSAGSAHVVPALRYGVPIVDLDFFWAHFALPEIVPELGFYRRDETVHPDTAGHTIAATLVMQELMHHVSLVAGSPSTDTTRQMQPSWRHLRGLPFHGQQDHSRDSDDTSTLPAPMYATSTFGYSCRLPRIERTKSFDEYFGEQLADKGDWEWKVEPRDGGRTRSSSRPGFVSHKSGRALVFRFDLSPATTTTKDKNNKQPVVFYRRSWDPSAVATAWTSKTFDPDEAAPQEAVVLNGTWASPNSQMTATTIPLPPDVRDGDSVFLFVKNTGRMAIPPIRGGRTDAYFKLYGFGI